MKKNLMHSFFALLCIFVSSQITGEYAGECERLLPLSCYGQAIQICMRVLADSKYQCDSETAIDLCVGRLCRLAQAVGQMEHKHKSSYGYPPEDIAYIIGLMGIVHQERQHDLKLSQTGLLLMMSIESKLALLLRHH